MAIFSDRIAQWRMQAEEYRTLAICAKTEGAKEAYLSLAADCETLADRFAETMDAARRDGAPTP